MHFGKPMLAMPNDCFEQRLNAQYVERMGFGLQVRRGGVTAEVLQALLDRADEFSGKAQELCRDGAAEALEAIDRFAGELTSGTELSALVSGSRSNGSPPTTARPGRSDRQRKLDDAHIKTEPHPTFAAAASKPGNNLSDDFMSMDDNDDMSGF